MKLIIVRHGETEANKAGIIQGHIDEELNEEGIAQAKKVALRLKEEKIDFVFASDLKRAADTARNIASYHRSAPFKIDKRLRERCHGEYEGKKAQELDWCIPAEKRGAETREDILKRAEDFLVEILANHGTSSVLFVCHGGIGKALISVITKIELDKLEHLHNTSVSIFEINEDKSHNINLLNCAKHLE